MENKIKIPSELLDAIKNKECVLFVASGLSSNVKRSNGKALPGWKSFLIELLEWAKSKRLSFFSDPDDIKEMINKGNLLMAAQELQDIISSGEFSDFLNDVFRDNEVIPSSTHLELTHIPFRAIVTTNYDSLIEAAYIIKNAGRVPKKLTQVDLLNNPNPLRKKDFFIFKLHGDMDRPETVVLGNKNYNHLMYKSPEYLSFLEVLFVTHTILFVGFGGSDYDLDFVINKLSTIFAKSIDKHYILLPSEKFNLTEKRRLLLDKRLEVIDYEKDPEHTQVDKFISNLSAYFKSTPTKKEIKTIRCGLLATTEDIQKNHRGQLTKLFDIKGQFKFISLMNIQVHLDDVEIYNKMDSQYDILVILITKDSLKTKLFEDEIKIALLNELEEKFRIYVFVVGNLELPQYITNRLYYKLENDFTAEDILNKISNN